MKKSMVRALQGFALGSGIFSSMFISAAAALSDCDVDGKGIQPMKKLLVIGTVVYMVAAAIATAIILLWPIA